MKPQSKQQIQKAIASGVDEKAKAITETVQEEARRISRDALPPTKAMLRMLMYPMAGYMFPDCRCPECKKARTR